VKWLAYLAGLLVAGVVVAFGLAWVLVDAGQVTNAAASRLAARIGRPVQLGEIDLSLFPSPAVRVQDVRIAGTSGASAAPLLRADEVRFNVSLVALFLGRTVFRSVDVLRPRIELEAGPDGLPEFPQLLPDVAQGGAAPDDDRAPGLLITSLSIREGSARIGTVEVEEIEISGGGNLDLSADFDLEASIPGIGRLANSRIELTNLVNGPVRWKATLALSEIDLAEAREQFGSRRAIYGSAIARVQLGGEAGRVESGALEIALRPLDLRLANVRINGDVDLGAELGKRYRIDLSKANVQISESFEKPVGGVVELEGPAPDLAAASGSNFDLREWRDWNLRLGSSKLRGNARLDDAGPSLEVVGDIDFVSLSKWARDDLLPAKGKLVIEDLRFTPSQGLRGAGSAEAIELALSDRIAVEIGGPVFIDGSRIGSSDLGIRWVDQNFSLRGSYDFAANEVDLQVDATGAELKGISESFDGQAGISGRIYASAYLSGQPTLEGLRGSGEFDIPGGELVNVYLGSFLRSEGDEREEGVNSFRNLSGKFQLIDAVMQFSRLQLEQADASALLRGTLSLRDGTIDLDGEARYFARDDTLVSLLEIEGPISQFRTTIRRPEDEAEQRKMERTMLTAMRVAIQERGAPADPELAKAFREQLERIDLLLQALDEKERELPIDVSARPEGENF